MAISRKTHAHSILVGQQQNVAGAVVNDKGLGARFRPEQFQSVRTAAGLLSGQPYVTQGLPVEVTEHDVTMLMQSIEWKVQPIPNTSCEGASSADQSLGCHNAATTPPRSIVKIANGRELITLYTQDAQPTPQSAKPHQPQAPALWSDAIKATLGRTAATRFPLPGCCSTTHLYGPDAPARLWCGCETTPQQTNQAHQGVFLKKPCMLMGINTART